MSARTKGPWVIRNDNEDMPKEYGPLWVIESILDPNDDESPYMEAILHHGCIIDAHLIAAAPDLLEVISYAIDNPDFDSNEFDLMARKAIAKATGSER